MPNVVLPSDFPSSPQALHLGALFGSPSAWTGVVQLALWAAARGLVRSDGALDLSAVAPVVIVAASGLHGDPSAVVSALEQSGCLAQGIMQGVRCDLGVQPASSRKPAASGAERQRAYRARNASVTRPVTPRHSNVTPIEREKEDISSLSFSSVTNTEVTTNSARDAVTVTAHPVTPVTDATIGEWRKAAAEVLGLPEDKVILSSAVRQKYAVQCERVGEQDLLRSVRGLRADDFARRTNPMALLSDTLVTKGLALAASPARSRNGMADPTVSQRQAWDEYFEQAKTDPRCVVNGTVDMRSFIQ